MPKKPTKPYGSIAFKKNGSVERSIKKLSHDKNIQERQVAEDFVAALSKRFEEFQRAEVRDLPEAGQDKLIHLPDREISLQITEIVERDYVLQISKEEYDSGKYNHFISRPDNEVPYAVDVRKRNNLLITKIRKKLQKRYAKSKDEILWLLIFSTSPYVMTVFVFNGQRKADKTLVEAIKFLEGESENPFDEIWYTNLLSRPVRIWPFEGLDGA